jgi:transcriptional regulator with XRE-family HTH domain
VTVPAEHNPTVDRRELAVFFHTVREQRELPLDEVAAVLGVTQSQASRLDTGARGFRPEDVITLCRWYGIREDEQARLLALARGSAKRAWWQQAKIAASYRTLIGMERAALSINEYCATVIPGLLQTRDYAEMAVAASQVGVQSSEAQTAVDVRIRRQEILARPQPPDLSVVIDEGALARGAGGADVMGPQLHHLLDMAKRPEITVQVIDFESGLYPTGAGQFILLRMGRALPDVYYAEDQLGRSDTSDDDALLQGWRLWQTLQAIALSPQRSRERIEFYRDRLPL